MSNTSPTLRLVRVYLGEHRMDVALDDPLSEKPRLVKYDWEAKSATDVPPEGWHSSVLAEVKYQRTREHNKQIGRALPER